MTYEDFEKLVKEKIFSPYINKKYMLEYYKELFDEGRDIEELVDQVETEIRIMQEELENLYYAFKNKK